MTDAERRLWWHLRRLPAEGSHFRRQATVGPYFADFACHAKRLIIELDGGQHGHSEHVARDGVRERYLRDNGYRVLRFWNNDVMQNIDGVLSVIADALHASSMPPPPDPSPPLRGGRGTL
jgi:very-short-patch-repair endonuclease